MDTYARCHSPCRKHQQVQRRNHIAQFRAHVVALCLQPHVSMASVARTHDLFAFDVLGLDEDLYNLTEEEIASVKEDLNAANGGCLFLLIGIILIPFTLGFSLFFIIGGLAELFGRKKSPLDVNKGRPKHQPKIQALIDELTRRTDG